MSTPNSPTGAALAGPSRPPLSCGKPKFLVVILHDHHSNGDEVVDLALDWAPVMNKAEFVAPHGPWPAADGKGRCWNVEGLEAETIAALEQYLSAMMAHYQLSDDVLALVGFGESAPIVLQCALSRPEAVGAVVAISHHLEGLAVGQAASRFPPPVLLLECKPAEPAASADGLEAIQHQLQALGVPVKRLSHPGDYFGLDDDGVAAVADFLHGAMVKGDMD